MIGWLARIRFVHPSVASAKAMGLCAAVVIGMLSCNAPAVAEVWLNANTSQFTSLALNTPTAVDFIGTGDLTMTRTSTVGSPIVTGTWNGSFTTPVGGQPNPDWVLGTRSYFQLASGSAGTLQSTVSYELQFATALPTTSQLVFIDFDSLEQVTIKAFDTSNTLIPFANTTILRSPGADTTPVYTGISWASSVGATGLLANTDNDSESNIIASISSSTAIQRIVYDFSFSQVDSGGGTIRFQVAAVPEPTTYAMALAGLACGLLTVRRNRRNCKTSSPAKTQSHDWNLTAVLVLGGFVALGQHAEGGPILASGSATMSAAVVGGGGGTLSRTASATGPIGPTQSGARHSIREENNLANTPNNYSYSESSGPGSSYAVAAALDLNSTSSAFGARIFANGYLNRSTYVGGPYSLGNEEFFSLGMVVFTYTLQRNDWQNTDQIASGSVSGTVGFEITTDIPMGRVWVVDNTGGRPFVGPQITLANSLAVGSQWLLLSA